MPTDAPSLTIRCGVDFTYYAFAPTPIILIIQPRLEAGQRIESELLHFNPGVTVDEYQDAHQNIVRRFELPIGCTNVRHDSFISISPLPENHGISDGPIPVSEMTPELIRYTLPSRYCDSDRLMNFAIAEFGHLPQGLERVTAICDWVHRNIEYRWGAGNPHTTASEVITQGFGICRDFAHVAIALCRCFNLPARYATGHLPDVASPDLGLPMDFHAYFQVFFGGRWNSYDARFNVPRIGRIHIASGFDAVDCAFSTLFGAAYLSWFEVWSYQVDPDEVKLGDPIDLSQRLDGTNEVRFPERSRTEVFSLAGAN